MTGHNQKLLGKGQGLLAAMARYVSVLVGQLGQAKRV